MSNVNVNNILYSMEFFFDLVNGKKKTIYHINKHLNNSDQIVKSKIETFLTEDNQVR